MEKLALINKRIKLNNGKTILVTMPADSDKRNYLKEAQKIISKYPFIKPCD